MSFLVAKRACVLQVGAKQLDVVTHHVSRTSHSAQMLAQAYQIRKKGLTR